MAARKKDPRIDLAEKLELAASYARDGAFLSAERVCNEAFGFGKLLPATSMILRISCGTANLNEAGSRRAYELSTIPGGSPIIRSETSGRWWIAGWDQLITCARAARIDDADPVVSGR